MSEKTSRCNRKYWLRVFIFLELWAITGLLIFWVPGCDTPAVPQKEIKADVAKEQKTGRIEKTTLAYYGQSSGRYNTDILTVDDVEYIVVYDNDKIAIIKHEGESKEKRPTPKFEIGDCVGIVNDADEDSYFVMDREYTEHGWKYHIRCPNKDGKIAWDRAQEDLLFKRKAESELK